MLAIEESYDFSCCGLDTFKFLFPHKNSFWELMYVLLLSIVYGTLCGYYLQKERTELILGTDSHSWFSIIGGIASGFNGFSLISQTPPESTPYESNSKLGFIYSTNYMRPVYGASIILVELVMWELDEMFLGFFEFLRIIFILLPLFFSFGLLSSLPASIAYGLEQIDIHAFGSTPRASDSRILMSVILNGVFVIISALLLGSSEKMLFVISAILGFIASHNILFNLGFLTLKRKVYQDSVTSSNMHEIREMLFSELGLNIKAIGKSTVKVARLLVKYVLSFAGVGLAIAGANIDFDEDSTSLPLIIDAIGFGLVFVAYILSSIHKIAIFRICPCPNKKSGSGMESVHDIFKILILSAISLGLTVQMKHCKLLICNLHQH
jgi:hypothetical protein